jgi:hypothetical protein
MRTFTLLLCLLALGCDPGADVVPDAPAPWSFASPLDDGSTTGFHVRWTTEAGSPCPPGYDKIQVLLHSSSMGTQFMPALPCEDGADGHLIETIAGEWTVSAAPIGPKGWADNIEATLPDSRVIGVQLVLEAF